MTYIISIFLFIVFLFHPHSVKAHTAATQDTQYVEAEVLRVDDKTNIVQKEIAGVSMQRIELVVTSKENRGKKITIETSTLPATIGETLKKGDKVIVGRIINPEGKQIYYIADFVRKRELLILFALFVAFVLFIGRLQGIFSFIGMLTSFYVIMNVIIPQILQGVNPVGITLIGSLIIIPVTFYLAHGLNKKTTIAVVSTFISLALTGALAYFFVDFVRLTGFAMEEAIFIQQLKGSLINIKNLLLAGIIIGALGILDDITISQTSVVEKLAEANPKYSFKELYFHAMSVGRDHIASLVNTLILVYAGAALPLFLLFSDAKLALSPIINHEIIATEIVRTLIPSIGIIAAVPITTLLACFSKKRSMCPFG